VGATDDLAPADRRLYAIRDVTATVESLPLITASILSKKLAGGADALVLDVKTGSGAFMPDAAEARALAESLVRVATGAGMPTVALLTDMDQPLGRTVGNALELHEAIAVLRTGAGDSRLLEVTLALAEAALVLGGLAADRDAARRLATRALEDGSAAASFARGVAALGGPTDLLESPDRHVRAAGLVQPVHPEREGWVGAIDARALGVAVVELGGGRARADDMIDHAVGLSDLAAVGEPVGGGRPLCLLHAADSAAAARAAARVRRAFRLAPSPPAGYGAGRPSTAIVAVPVVS
jgi:thymidine phosphorylase